MRSAKRPAALLLSFAISLSLFVPSVHSAATDVTLSGSGTCSAGPTINLSWTNNVNTGSQNNVIIRNNVVYTTLGSQHTSWSFNYANEPAGTYSFYIVKCSNCIPSAGAAPPGAASSNTVSVAKPNCPDIDIGLRAKDSGGKFKVAVEVASPPTSKLRIRKNGQTYGVQLVERNDPSASKILVKTSAGIKALKVYQRY